ncbi:nuclear factor related to kappa-B-binding protein [Ochlerotatus camptorhynchus]|uniref:nuclear factor related to kappa-B-binding protein n=1 Tax=Ochlerotatus camptorhynchus TaxID=644619 RepID=UPI0031DA5181
MDQSTVEDEEYSDCSRDSSSSELTTTSGSSASVQETSRKQFESTKITTEIINLPKELCEDKTVFKEFFSLDTWHSLSDPIRKHLGLFLPMFTDNIEFEKNSTIESLFSNRITRFGSCPLERLQQSLEEGNCRPEISTLNKSIAKAERREQRFQESERLTELARKVSVSRERTLRKVCQNTQPNELSSSQYVYAAKSPLFSSANALRAKKRYLQEISSIAEQLSLPDILSDDEKCSDAVLNYIPRKQRRLFGTVQGGAASPGADVRIVNTLGFKDEQTTTGYLVGPNGKISIAESHYRDLLVHHKRRKFEEPDHPDLDCQEIKLKDVVVRTQASSGYRRIMPLPKVNVAEETLAAAEEKINLSKCQGNNTTSTPSYPESCSLGDLKISTTKSSVHDMMKSADKNVLDVCNSDESISLNHTADSSRAASEPEVYIKTIRLDSDREIENCSTEIKELGVSDVGENNTSAHSVALMDEYTDSNADVSSEMIDSFRPIKESQIPDKIEIETDDPVGRSTPNIENIQISCTQEDNNSLLLVKAQDEDHATTNVDEQEQDNASGQSTLHSFEKSSYEKSMPELMQATHKCFLSLLRDMFCSTPDHRLTIDDLQIKLNVWLKTPIAALNDWYLQADDKWDDMLQSAILFLSGEFSDQPDDFVPYIEHKVQLNIYQWIGASRDSDHRLLDLCQYWLRRRHEMGIRIQSKPIKTANSKQKYASSNSSTTVEDDDGSSERTMSPPPPRYPTDWSVRKATDEEVQLFREQERNRYENPHMAFTYKQHSYNSVVGPVKGIYTQVPGISKARGHNMLVADRPNFVTILTLVRDATARLPNGEGTRADICELLKSSQYISPTATDQVLQTIVSGALDRMHTEHDPCVKYDTKRKIWIYLHRSRTEEEFERLHHQYQGVAKHKKPVYRKSKPKEATGATPRKAVSEPLMKSNSQSSLENDSLHSEPTPEIGSMSTNMIESPISVTTPSILVKSNVTTIVASDKTPNSSSLPSLILSQKVAVPQNTSKENNPVMQHTQPSEESSSRIELKEKDSSKFTVCTSSPIVSQINKETVPIRMNSMCKIQAVQLSNTQPHAIVRATKPIQASDTNPDIATTKSILAKQIITTTVPAKPLVISSTPSTVASFCNISGGIPVQVSMAGSVGDGDRIAHSFIVPVTLSAESGGARARLVPSTSQISISKPNRVQSVQQPTPVTVKATSLLQTKHSMSLLSQLPSTGKCVVQPESYVVATNRQQKVACVSSSSSNTLTTSPAAVLLKTDGGTQSSGVDIINTITMPKGQQSVLTPAQQKQILQNLLAQQNKQVFTSKSVIIGQSITSNANTTCFVNSSNVTTNAQGIHHVKGARQLQKIPALTLSSSNTRGTSTVFQTIGSNVGNPHVIQIKSASNMLSSTSGAKIRPIITTLKEHSQAKQLQQSLIAKSANLQLKNDVQEINVVKTSSNVNVLSEMSKSASTMVQSAVSGASVTHMMKSAASIVHPSPNVIRTVNVTQGAPHVMAKVVKGVGENQYVSLDSLLPRQQIGDAAIRLTEPKTMKTQLIHLSSSGPAGSPIAQYAVVPQNRNIISVAQSSGHCTTPTIITTTASRFTDPKTTQILATSHNTVTSVSHTPVTSIAHRNGAETGTNLIQSVQSAQGQLQQQNVPQVVTKLSGTTKMLSAKVRNGTSFINSSSINFATIGGNPLIIASKPAIRSETIQHNSTSSVFQSSPVSTESANIVYGRQAVKVQGNIVSQGHVNIVSAQQGSNTTPQKLLLSNQLVKVRTVPRQPHQMQISFAQQPGVSTGLGTSTGISVVKTQGITIDQQEKSLLTNVSPKPTMLATPVKATQKVGIRLNQPTQRVVLATQGGQLVTQQIIVPQGFQGGAFNIKRLKVIPVNSQQKGSILRPQVVTTQQKPASSSINTATTLAVSDASIEGNNKFYHVFNSSGSGSSNLNDSVELNMDPNMK